MCGFFAKKYQEISISAYQLNLLGEKYERGDGVEKDPEAAFSYYKKSSEKGDFDGTFNLGRMYLKGMGTVKDASKGSDLITIAAKAGNVWALAYVAGVYYKKSMFRKSFEMYKRAADKGHTDSIYHVGMMYYYGLGTERSSVLSNQFLEKANTAGHDEAYRAIYGRPPNKQRKIQDAVLTYSLPAFKGYMEAAMRSPGENILKALDVYRKFADAEEAEEMVGLLKEYCKTGQDSLGAELVLMYLKAKGGDPDPDSIDSWVRKVDGRHTDYACITEPRFRQELLKGNVRFDSSKIVQPEKQVIRGSEHEGVKAASSKYAVRTYRWKYRAPYNNGYQKKDAVYELKIRRSDYEEAARSDVKRRSGDIKDYKVFVTPRDRYVKEIAHFIKTLTKGMSDMDRANCALKFVQSFRYTSDPEQFGKADYAIFPVEMLWSETGDCEDFAILYASIMSALGFDMALIFVKSPNGYHMAAGICHRDAEGYSIPYGRKKYCYCEATSTVNGDPNGDLKVVGRMSETYLIQDIIPVP